MTELAEWIAERGVEEVEVLVPDMNGVLRGKVMPARALAAAAAAGSLRLASSVFAVTVTGAYAYADDDADAYQDPDMVLRPDPASLGLLPGCPVPTAFVFADAERADGTPWACAPREVLRRAIALFAERGWQAAIAPELEFYLTAPAGDPSRPLASAPGRSGRPGSAAPYSLEALDEHQAFIDQVYADAAFAGLELETAIHESGAGQLEINLTHGDPLRRADQAAIFKRLVRRAGLDHGLAATFMAKPLENEAPSAMHLHLSLSEAASGRNLFADKAGADSGLFREFLGGLQAFLPQIAPLYAPYPNSFRRMRPRHSAPVNVQWGRDNRSCGLRVPICEAANRRVEIRLPGADANPYLAMAAAMISGFLGIEGAIAPAPEAGVNAYGEARTLPRTMEEAMDRFAACAPVRARLGEAFVGAFLAVKEAELASFSSQVTPWERDHLLAKA